MGTITNKIQLNQFSYDQHAVQQYHFGTTYDDNQEHYVIIKISDHKSDSHLDNSQQIAGANSDTKCSHTNDILQPEGSSISTIVSMKCASTDISTTGRVSTDVSTEFVSTNVCMNVFTKTVYTGVSTNIPTGVTVL